jgi:hypothetical protein
MKSQIVIHGPRVHGVGFRLALLQYIKKFRFLNFEAFNDSNDRGELLVVLVEGDEGKINDLIENIKLIKPESAIVHGITTEPYDGDIHPFSSFSQDLQMEQMTKAVPILLEIKDLQMKTVGLQEKTIDLQQEAIGLHKQALGMHHDSLKKQDETLVEIRGLREDIRETFNDRLTKIEESLHTIKSALEQAKILG